MNIWEILASSTVSTILIGIIVFVLREWIKERLSKSIQHEYDIDLESYKNNLNRELEFLKTKFQTEFEIYKTSITHFSNEQFKIYNELWIILCDLKNIVDYLWKHATYENLLELSNQLKIAKDKINKSAIILEPDHFNELQSIIKVFEDYNFGKRKLIEFERQNQSSMLKINQIAIFITENQEIKNRLENYLSNLQNCFRNKLNDRLSEMHNPRMLRTEP